MEQQRSHAERVAKVRDQKIAENESARQNASSIRLSAWAVGVFVVVALAIVALRWA
ncbi:MAG TPA: hypothetical protein VNZ94_11855 [Xanthobacteraceae bacterium]|nr:hypothetical protein [Xanthobacteraceae bacterium]